MTPGQKVRIKEKSPLARNRRIRPGAFGLVLCSYEHLRPELRRGEYIDVQLDAKHVLWAIAADNCELVSEQ